MAVQTQPVELPRDHYGLDHRADVRRLVVGNLHEGLFTRRHVLPDAASKSRHAVVPRLAGRTRVLHHFGEGAINSVHADSQIL